MIEFDFSKMTIGDVILINYYSSIYDAHSLAVLINKFTPLDIFSLPADELGNVFAQFAAVYLTYMRGGDIHIPADASKVDVSSIFRRAIQGE